MVAIKKKKTDQSLKGQTWKLTDLVHYQQDVIVSRELVQRKSGSVTIFAFDRGQRLSEHSAPFDALIQDLEGEAEVTIAGKAHNLHPGEMIILPANKPHGLKALTRFKMVLIMVKS